VWNLVEQAAADRATVFYTLVYDKARAAIQEAAQHHTVAVVDLLEPVLVSLYDLLKTSLRAKPGILYRSNKAHYDRIDAVEFTLHHDDGRGIHELGDADVVLVGPSRSSKSTTCFYLAYSGIRAANVPLFADAEPPQELLALDPRRVIGLTVNPHRLRAIREARLRDWGSGLDAEYADPAQIARELRSTHELMVTHGWACVDVSYIAIEEIARRIRQLLGESGIPIHDRAAPRAEE
jgi:regulator of PEP synthase PpsR (kinase-PPPase family)